MPPLEPNAAQPVLERGARALGIGTDAVPLLINSVPYGGRPACIQCQHCVGFACSTDAKNGTQNTLIPRALATGRCDLVAEATVERIDCDRAGRVVGVTYIDRAGLRHSPGAEVVICAAGAIET